MTISQTPREFLSGKLAQVDVAHIENELRGLWQQVNNGEENITGDVARVVSFTFIIFATDVAVEPELHAVIDDIVSFHPCRSIITLYRENLPHSMSAWVTAKCHLIGQGKHVCSEQITVQADGAGAKELYSVVSPLVLADLPVVLWWRSRNLDHRVMNELLSCTHKVIFDSAYEPFSIKVIHQAADLVIQHADRIWLADLNWQRLTCWRRSLAEAFDGFPMEAQDLNKIERIKIDVAGAAGNGAGASSGSISAQALLLVGWLSSRLGWRYERDNTGKNVLRFKHDLSEIQVEFVEASESALPAGSINAVTVEFAGANRLDVKLEQLADSYLLTANNLKTTCKESSRIDPQFAESALMGQELSSLHRDRIFEQSLLLAGEICRNLE